MWYDKAVKLTTEYVCEIGNELIAMKKQTRNLVMATACIVGLSAAAALKYEPGGYVQDGLVAHFDGIRNAGAGKAHDTLATTWVDLTANHNDATLLHDAAYASRWRADGFRFEGGSFFELAQNITLTNTVTVQVVCDVDTNELIVAKRSYPQLVGAGESDNYNIYYAVGYAPPRLVFKNASGGHVHSTSFFWEGQYATAIRDGNLKRLFQTGDGSGELTVSGTQGNIGAQTWRIGAATSVLSTRNNNRLVGTIQSLRVYNRVLTTAELEANRAIDDARFKTGLPVTNVVVATSVRGVEGTEPSGVYAVDGSHAFSAPTTVTVGPDTYACTGYTLEEWDGSAWGAPVLHGGVLAAEIAESSPKVRLTWQWSHTAGPGMLDVDAYASDGLEMFFDGYRNAGRTAPHDSSATSWANLVGTTNNAPLTINDAESKWLENGYFFGGATYGQLVAQQYLGSNYTIQIACDMDPREQFAIRAANDNALRWPHLFGAGSADCCNFYYHLEWGTMNAPICFKDVTGTRPNLYSWEGRYVTGVRDGISYKSSQGVTMTGGASTAIKAEDIEKGSMPVGKQTWYIATAEGNGGGKTARCLTGAIHAIRVYGRVLTDEEMTAHRVLDEARFWGRPTTNGMVIVASRVAGLAGNEPNGAYRPAAYAFSAPTGTFTVGDKDYQLDGYVVETWDPYAQSWRIDVTGAGNSWTSPAGTDWASRRLTWKWKVVRGLKTYGTGDYVQEGLVLHLDGIRNKGADRPHDGNMIYSWHDLSWRRGRANIVERMPCDSAWLDDGYYFAGSNYVQTAESFSIGTNLTAEMLCEVDNTVQKATYPTYFSGYWNDAFVVFTRNTTGTTLEWKQDEFAGGTRPKAANWKGRNFSATLSDTASILYEDGAAKVTQARARVVRFNPTPWRLMDNGCDWLLGDNVANPVYNHNAIGTIHTARLYNRALTAAEVVWNRKVDAARYEGMPPVTNVVVAAGQYDASVEAPGVYEVEGTWTFSATNVVDNGKTKRVAGYTLETWTDGAWGAPTAYEGSSCTYTVGTSPAKVRLTWLWQRDGVSIIIR